MKHSKWRLHTNFFLSAVILQLLVYSSVITRSVNLLTLVLWLCSLICIYKSFKFLKKKETKKKVKFNWKGYIPIIVVVFLALTVRIYFMLDETHFHYDEYITAGFSYSLGKVSSLDWFGMYPAQGVWVSQFPILYFVIQKIFLGILGLGTVPMRLSILPYIIFIFVFLFLTAKQLFGKEVGFIAIIILTLLSPDLYITRWALHFTSSTAFFMATSYFFILSYKFGKKWHFALTGLFGGLAYLTYYSSYLTAPLIIIFLISLLLKRIVGVSYLKNFVISIAIFVFTVSPWVTYAVKVDNFLIQRTDQVGLLGSWSPYKNINSPINIAGIVFKQIINTSLSLFKDGIGGSGEYYFGKLALFDTFTFVLLLAGLAYFIYKVVTKFEPESVFIVTTIVGVFILGMVLTIPPPAFHRTSIAFPFVSIVISRAIYDGYCLFVKKKVGQAKLIFIICLSILLLSNINHFQRILVQESLSPQIENDIKLFPENKVYIAAYPGYLLGNVLFFRSEGKTDSVTGYLETILNLIPRNESSLLVVFNFNGESYMKIVDKFPKTKIVALYPTQALLMVNQD